jgi:two-component system, OmpR family, sensor kinase
VTRRWRPSLALVLGGALAGTLGLSFAGLVALRYLGPEIGFRNAAMLLAGLIVLATAGLGGLLIRLLLRPIVALERYAVAQNQGSVTQPDHFGTQELHRTAQAVIEMTEALRNREATIRSFTDHVTHALKTPVSTIRAGIELMEDSPTLTAEDREVLARLDGARGQIEAQLAALRNAARAREARYLGQTTLAEVAENVRYAGPGLQVAILGDTVPIPISAGGLLLVLSHLAQNASDHGARRITLDAHRTDHNCTLDISDDGRGISPGNADHIFEPFFTTRPDTGGTGMGLAIVRNILGAHHATIDHVPSPAETLFRIQFRPAA